MDTCVRRKKPLDITRTVIDRDTPINTPRDKARIIWMNDTRGPIDDRKKGDRKVWSNMMTTIDTRYIVYNNHGEKTTVVQRPVYNTSVSYVRKLGSSTITKLRATDKHHLYVTFLLSPWQACNVTVKSKRHDLCWNSTNMQLFSLHEARNHRIKRSHVGHMLLNGLQSRCILWKYCIVKV